MFRDSNTCSKGVWIYRVFLQASQVSWALFFLATSHYCIFSPPSRGHWWPRFVEGNVAMKCSGWTTSRRVFLWRSWKWRTCLSTLTTNEADLRREDLQTSHAMQMQMQMPELRRNRWARWTTCMPWQVAAMSWVKPSPGLDTRPRWVVPHCYPIARCRGLKNEL